MRKQFIATNPDGWGKAETPESALEKAEINIYQYDVTTILEVTYPDNETDADDIIFYRDGDYELKGRTTAIRHKGEVAIDNLLGNPLERGK